MKGGLREALFDEVERETRGKRGRSPKQSQYRKSMKFFSHEKYHYSQNLKIEQELRDFKYEIEMKYRRSLMNRNY